jgi:hypothetical protein
MPSTPAADRERPRRPSLRRGTRAAALVAPWVLVVAVLASPLRTPGTTATTGSQASGGTASGGTAATRSSAAPSAAETASPAGAAPPAPAGAGATATRLVRDAVTGRNEGTTTAIDVAVPETPRWLGSQVWLVRVHAVLLHGDAQRWRSATHEIWAVPMGVQAGRLVGLDHPWRVATDDSRIAPAHWEPATVDEATVRAALLTVGAQPVHDLHAEQHPEVAEIIRVQVAVGTHRHHVWLRTTPSVRVLGAPAAPAERPATTSTERPRS